MCIWSGVLNISTRLLSRQHQTRCAILDQQEIRNEARLWFRQRLRSEGDVPFGDIEIWPAIWGDRLGLLTWIVPTRPLAWGCGGSQGLARAACNATLREKGDRHVKRSRRIRMGEVRFGPSGKKVNVSKSSAPTGSTTSVAMAVRIGPIRGWVVCHTSQR